MKKLLLPIAVLSILLCSCSKVQQEPFKASNCDSVTIKDGSENPITISVRFLMDSTCILNDIIETQDEYADFIDDVFWNLQKDCNYPRTFKPKQLFGMDVIKTELYNEIPIYHIKTLATGIAANAFGVEGDVDNVLNLIAWKEVYTWDDGDTDSFWRVVPDDEWWMEKVTMDIDTYKTRIQK